jgi:ABC-2 type transport system ATP-binding protein
VRDLDLNIEEGEILSLLGPNGAGKTTLIGLLSGLLPASDGQARIEGHDVAAEPLAVKRLIGVVPEEIALYPRLSGWNNLRFFGQLHGLSGEELDQAIVESLDAVDLTGRAHDRAASYSSGMKRRLNLAVALVHRPRILLLDEPTVGLDPQSRRTILDLVSRLRSETRATILYATHHMPEAQEISDRVAVMHDGRLVAIGTPAELIRLLPGRESVRLSVGPISEARTLLRDLKSVPGVTSVSCSGEDIIISADDIPTSLPAILNTLAAMGVTARSIDIRQPDLEALFLHLTGRPLTTDHEHRETS